jgi:hypothetical protein
MLCDILRERKREFRDSDSDGAIMSTCMLGNYLGTPEEAAIAIESAAEHVCQMLQADHETHKYVPVPIHRRTLDRFEDLLTQRKISDLSFRQTGYMSKAWIERHYIRSVEGGGCQRGPMTGAELIAHTNAIAEGGGSKAGRMTGAKLIAHTNASVEGGATKPGRMTSPGRDGKSCMKNNVGFIVLVPPRIDCLTT